MSKLDQFYTKIDIAKNQYNIFLKYINIDIDVLKQRFNSLDYSMSKDTVRQDSIGQQELIYLYKQKFN
jgi:hypothetical protein